jgi:hypothetical protein
MRLPLAVDGATFNLKVSGKLPTIVIEQDKPLRRRRFTLAHELGHVLIPWHAGSIVDQITFASEDRTTAYSILESEANRFASELLMPAEWMVEIMGELENPPEILECIADQAEVSRIAAAIRLIDCMPAGYTFAVVDADGIATFSGRSPDTIANRLELGAFIDSPETIFEASDKRWESKHAEGLYLWWRFPREAALPKAGDRRSWREILAKMIHDIGVPQAQSEKFKQSVNGVVAYANGVAPARTAEAIYSAALQRFHSKAHQNDDFRKLVKHKNFSLYLVDRIDDLLAK